MSCPSSTDARRLRSGGGHVDGELLAPSEGHREGSRGLAEEDPLQVQRRAAGEALEVGVRGVGGQHPQLDVPGGEAGESGETSLDQTRGESPDLLLAEAEERGEVHGIDARGNGRESGVRVRTRHDVGDGDADLASRGGEALGHHRGGPLPRARADHREALEGHYRLEDSEVRDEGWGVGGVDQVPLSAAAVLHRTALDRCVQHVGREDRPGQVPPPAGLVGGENAGGQYDVDVGVGEHSVESSSDTGQRPVAGDQRFLHRELSLEERLDLLAEATGDGRGASSLSVGHHPEAHHPGRRTPGVEGGGRRLGQCRGAPNGQGAEKKRDAPHRTPSVVENRYSSTRRMTFRWLDAEAAPACRRVAKRKRMKPTAPLRLGPQPALSTAGFSQAVPRKRSQISEDMVAKYTMTQLQAATRP